MKKRRTFTREFKISVLRELENGKSSAQVCREHSVHPSVLSKWKQEYKENPKMAFGGNGNICKLNAQVGEYERIIGRQCAEINFVNYPPSPFAPSGSLTQTGDMS